MLVQKENLIEIRERFKLNIYEVKIWTSLLSKGIAAASELAEISGVPRSRCYDVLESLEKKGYIIMKIGKPIKYIAVQPNAVMDRVKKRLKDEAEHQLKIVDKLEDTEIFKELELLYKTGVKKIDVSRITNSISGINNVNKFIKEMLLRAKKNITIVTNEEGVKNKLKILKKVNETLKNRNIKIKFYTNSYQINLSTDLKNVERFNSKHDTRFVNIDNREILFIMPDKDPQLHSGVWINSPHFVNELNILYEKSLK